MENEIKLDFRIWGYDDIEAKEITEYLGLEPSRIIIAGQKINPKSTNPNAVFKNNCWIINSPKERSDSFEEHLNSLLNIIEPKIDLFKLFCNKYFSEFSCYIVISASSEESRPWIHLGSRFNKVMYELNCEFDVDLQILP